MAKVGSKRFKLLALLAAMLSSIHAWGQLLPTKWDAETEILPISQVEEGDFQIGVMIKPVFRYRLYSLMDEPVEISQLAWCIPNSPAICTWRPKYWKRMGSPVIQENVPPDVLAKIRIINAKVVGYLRERTGSWMAPTSSGRGLFLVFDPGILDRPYLGSLDTFLTSLTPEQREKPYFGFNFPGSPNWKEFIRISSQSKTGAHWPTGVLDEPVRYETPETARSILKRGFALDSIRVEKIGYDFWPVKDWIAKKRAQELASERRKFEAQVREAATAEERAKSVKNALAETQARQAKEAAAAELDKRLAEERSLNAEISYIAEESRKASVRLAEERKRVEARRIQKGGAAAPSASLLFLVDTSGSMSGTRLASAKEAALKSARDAVRQGAEVAVLAFSGDCGSPIAARLDFTREEDEVRAFIEKLSANGGTPLSPALKEANAYMERAGRAESAGRMIILLADGNDDCGGLDAVLAEIGRKTVVVRHETIGLEVGAGPAADQLRRIALATGGKYHYAASSSELMKRFEAAMDAVGLLDMIGTFGGSSGTTPPTSGGSGTDGMQSILDTFN